jgi:hypothetical protein
MTDRPISDHQIAALVWRLYITAALAAIYLACWRAVGGAATVAPFASAPTAGVPPPSRQRAAVWLDEIPVARRPQIAPPAGWTVVERAGSVVSRRGVHAPVARPLRARTRSS